MSQDSETPVDALDAAEARRAAAKEATKAAFRAQRAEDINAIADLEETHGDSNVGVIHVQPLPDLPTCAAVRCPKPIEVKRFRDLVRPKKDGSQPDAVGPAEQLARVCRIYPTDVEAYKRLCEARPGLEAQLGAKAIELATGRDETEGKG